MNLKHLLTTLTLFVFVVVNNYLLNTNNISYISQFDNKYYVHFVDETFIRVNKTDLSNLFELIIQADQQKNV